MSGLFDTGIFDVGIFDAPINVSASLQGKFGTVSNFVGEFKSNRGKLSESSIVLQDNLKYQEYSYVVRTSESILLWGDLLKKLIHPAGYGLYSETVIATKVEISPITYNKTFNNIINYDIGNVSINSTTNNYNNLISESALDGVGYNTYELLRKLNPNIPPIKTIEQINLDGQDAVYGGYSDYNYSGTTNQGYWFNATAGDSVNTFCDSVWGDLDFLGSLATIDYKPRNFKIEEYYDLFEIATGISFATKPILLPDSFIKIY